MPSPSFLTRLTEQHRFKYYDLCLSFFVVVLLISNLVAPKICQIGPLTLSGSQLLFPLTYIFGDIFTEVYGYAGSRRAIWHGFLAQALLTVLAIIIVYLPPAPGWGNQAAIETVFGFLPRLVLASLIAFWCGEFANSFVMAKMKIITKGEKLWARTISSTAAGQLVDTILMMVIGFGGTMSWDMIYNLIWSGYLVKVAYEVLATPLTYLVVNTLKKAEGVDLYDTDTDFNPFVRMS